jgi:pantoate kinase
MIRAYCPAHVTCFFQPVRTDDVRTTGSRGAGIRLGLGAEARVSENRSVATDVTMDGHPAAAPVTRLLAERMAPGRGFDIVIGNMLPPGQGFGMSAAGAVAVALCLAEILGPEAGDPYAAAHAAEVLAGGGLGDVAGIMAETDQPVRLRPGLPPEGETVGTGVRFGELTLAVLGDGIDTGRLLSDPLRCGRIAAIGARAVDSYMASPSAARLFGLSEDFSAAAGLESPRVSAARAALAAEGIASGMCMLGDSLFIDAGADRTAQVLDDAVLFVTGSSSAPAAVIRRG